MDETIIKKAFFPYSLFSICSHTFNEVASRASKKMATPPENSEKKFPPADIDGELNPGSNRQVEVDPVSSEIAASKEQAESKQKKIQQERQQKDAMHTLKSAIIIAGIVAAVAGAAFVITKKLREK